MWTVGGKQLARMDGGSELGREVVAFGGQEGGGMCVNRKPVSRWRRASPAPTIFSVELMGIINIAV